LQLGLRELSMKSKENSGTGKNGNKLLGSELWEWECGTRFPNGDSICLSKLNILMQSD